MQSEIRILRLPEVLKKTGLSRSSVYAKEAAGQFPHHIELGSRCSGWLAHEVNTWLEARIAASRPHAATSEKPTSRHPNTLP